MEEHPSERKQRMLWIILSIVCAVYYAAVRYVAQAQQLTGIWLILAVLFLLMFSYGRYRKKHPDRIKGYLRVRTFLITTMVLMVLILLMPTLSMQEKAVLQQFALVPAV